MRKRWLTLAALAVVTVLWRRRSPPCAAASASAAHKAAASSACLVTDIGGLNDKSFNHLAYVGLQQRARRAGHQGRVSSSRSRRPTTSRTSRRARSQGDDITIGVGFLMADAMDTVATKFPNSKFAIIDVDATSLKHKPKNVEGLLFKEQEAGYLVGYARGPVGEGARRHGGRLRRRPQDPAGRPLHRRLPVRREEGRPGHQDAERLLAGLRRPGEVQGDRARPDRPGLDVEFQVAGGAASARSTRRRRRASWVSASTPTRASSART